MDSVSSVQPTLIPSGRPQNRQLVSCMVIGVATVQVLGLTLKTPSLLGVNDISRWCTVWALLERGTYAIDECPWRSRTIDVVYRANPSEVPPVGGEPVRHFYSNKPALLPTLIAVVLYPFRAVSGVPLDREIPGRRASWPAYVLYFKPVVVILNVLPFLLFLILYARLLDRFASNDWAWFVSLLAAAWGTPLFAFNETLNNHTIAAYSAFFALYAALRIDSDGGCRGLWFGAAGFFAAFCACTEVPAGVFGVFLFGMLLVRFARPTLLYFVPAAAIPCAAFLATEYLAHGSPVPIDAEFGTQAYKYMASYWNNPTGLDALNEPKYEYVYNMLLGHHGLFSLTPIYLFAIVAAVAHLRGPHPLSGVARLAVILTVAMVAFYAWKTNNYGGATAGMRWLFWLHPFWLILLPLGLAPAHDDRLYRWLVVGALLLSVLTASYAALNPWTHPWPLDLMEHLGVYDAGD